MKRTRRRLGTMQVTGFKLSFNESGELVVIRHHGDSGPGAAAGRAY